MWRVEASLRSTGDACRLQDLREAMLTNLMKKLNDFLGHGLISFLGVCGLGVGVAWILIPVNQSRMPGLVLGAFGVLLLMAGIWLRRKQLRSARESPDNVE